MHPELLSSLAAEHRRDLATASDRRARLSSARPARARPSGAFRARRARQVSLTRTRLAAISGRRRGSSLIIVISATRTS